MNEQIEIKSNKEKVKIILPASSYVRQKIDWIEEYLEADIQLEDNGFLALIYQKPDHASSLETVIKETMTERERLELAQKMAALVSKEADFKTPYLHPKNIYVQGSLVRVIHHGIKGIMAPAALDSQSLLQRYKALVVAILRPKLDFDLLVDGLPAVKDQMVQELAACENLDQVLAYINRVCHEKIQEEKVRKTIVSKRNWLLFKIGTGFFGLAAGILALLAAYLYFWSLPVQDATVEAQSHYIAGRYDDVADALEDFQVGRLGREAKYILAASYVHLDALSDNQKASVLNTITPTSEMNLLDYWIYFGRGNYKKSLDLAQNIGDNQLTLHAYTNLYEQVRNDKKMDGAEKQKKLDEYQKEIEDLSKKLGVKVGEENE